MAAPVVASSTTGAYVNASSVTITKPSGLAVGDYLVAYISGVHSGSFTLTTPTNWTLQRNGGAAEGQVSLYTKIADSADVAAADFNFVASTTISRIGGILLRVTSAVLSVSEIDGTTSTASPSFTGASTPTNATSLVLMSIFAERTDGIATISSYASTPSFTWAELQEISVNEGVLDPSCAVAWAATTDTTQITAYSATLSQSKTNITGSLILFIPNTNASGTVALHAVSPTFFTPVGSGGVSGTTALLAVSPTLFSASGISTTAPVWTNPDKPSTTWTNPNK